MGHLHVKFQKARTIGFRDMAGDGHFTCEKWLIQIFQSPTADPDFVAAGRRLVGHVTHVMGHLHAKFQKDRTSGFRDMAGDSRTDGRTDRPTDRQTDRARINTPPPGHKAPVGG